IAFINKEDCIGCTKCLKHCPADAIVGAKKQLHIIINHYCTGCDLCIDVCPTNCISTVSTLKPLTMTQTRQRYQQHAQRLAKQTINTCTTSVPTTNKKTVSRKTAVAEAIKRAKLKRMQLQNNKTHYEPE